MIADKNSTEKDIKCPDPSALLEPMKEFIGKALKNGTTVPTLLRPLLSPSI
jgi:hypothetical protein